MNNTKWQSPMYCKNGRHSIITEVLIAYVYFSWWNRPLFSLSVEISVMAPGHYNITEIKECCNFFGFFLD